MRGGFQNNNNFSSYGGSISSSKLAEGDSSNMLLRNLASGNSVLKRMDEDYL
jgi:hypothetical protein